MKKRRRTILKSIAARRSIAFLIDIIILDIVVMRPFHILLINVLPSTSFRGIMDANMPVLYVTLFFWAIFALAYFILLEYAIGQTIGKILFDLKVKSEKGELGFFQAVARNLVLIPFFPFTILWILDPVLMVWKGKRGSEYLSKTYTR
ncbi:MAG: RDD family protein [Candidatus Woesearchaeota archaeon]